MASFVVDLVLHDVARTMHNSVDPDRTSSWLPPSVTRRLLEEMRAGQDVTADVLCAIDAVDSVANARQLELSQDLLAQYGVRSS